MSYKKDNPNEWMKDTITQELISCEISDLSPNDDNNNGFPTNVNWELMIWIVVPLTIGATIFIILIKVKKSKKIIKHNPKIEKNKN